MIRLILFACLAMMQPSLLAATDVYPLAPADTTSPRNTYRYFIEQMDRAYHAHLDASYKDKEVDSFVMKAVKCLDLSDVASADRYNTGFETAILLKEVVDRIPIPPLDKMPDSAMVEHEQIDFYILPGTEMRIVRMADGPRKGEFLFDSQTVELAKEFYDRVQNLPYKPGASIGAYEDYLSQPGWMMPTRLINRLPPWMNFRVWNQTLWQWISLLVTFAITGGLLLLINRLTTIQSTEEKSPLRWVFSKLIQPVSVLALLIVLAYFVEKQIGIIGGVWLAIKYILRLVWVLVAVWAVLIITKGTTEAIIVSRSYNPEGIDANITRMLSRLATLILLMALLWNLSEHFGVSLTAVFASAGIAGMAIAFAARETLSNLFGGASILLDRPFKAGDYIILEDGDRGKVVEVGLRSTRILTRDEVLISIPNATITNTKIINESAPRPHFRIRLQVGVAYGSDIEQVEKILLDLAAQNRMVKQTPPPIVRLRGFGDSSLDFELLCWTRQAELKGRLISDLYRKIYMAFGAAGIVIPFPQRDVHFDVPTAGESRGPWSPSDEQDDKPS